MRELLFLANDKVNPDDPKQDIKFPKRGMVLVHMPEGHPWTKKELENPDWRIVKMDITEEEANEFLRPEIVTVNPLTKPVNIPMRFRSKLLDLDAVDLHPEIADVLANPEKVDKVTLVTKAALVPADVSIKETQATADVRAQIIAEEEAKIAAAEQKEKDIADAKSIESAVIAGIGG